MKWSIRIATIAGTEVRIHLTFFLLLLWIGVAAFLAGGAVQAGASLVFVSALFLCVLLHEFGHVTAARFYGIETPDITLLPIGGLARLKSIPRNPAHEFVIAIAGPLVNVAIFLVLSLLIGVMGISTPEGLELGKLDFALILPLLTYVNLALAVFNMIPAFPMDGGRILRALLAMAIDHSKATSIAAHVGQALAIAGGIFGLLIGHPILILIAVFIFFGAAAEHASTRLREETENLPVRDAMMTKFVTLSAATTIQEAVDALLADAQRDFPVLGDHGNLLGILHHADIITALANEGPDCLVGNCVRPCPGAVLETATVSDAMTALQESQCSAVPVIDSSQSRLLGLVTAENISELLMVIHASEARQQRLRQSQHYMTIDPSTHPLEAPTPSSGKRS